MNKLIINTTAISLVAFILKPSVLRASENECNFAKFERSATWISKTWPDGKRDKLLSDSKIANCPTHITVRHYTGMLSVLSLSGMKMNDNRKKYDCLYRSDKMKFDDPESLLCEFD